MKIAEFSPNTLYKLLRGEGDALSSPNGKIDVSSSSVEPLEVFRSRRSLYQSCRDLPTNEGDKTPAHHEHFGVRCCNSGVDISRFLSFEPDIMVSDSFLVTSFLFSATCPNLLSIEWNLALTNSISWGRHITHHPSLSRR